MSNIRDFFASNNVRIGKDFDIQPPVYYYSLNDAFYNYFITFSHKKDAFHLIFDAKDRTRESIAFNFTPPIGSIVSSILGFHRFFELLLKDILKRIHPFLAVKFLEKEEDLFKFLNNELSAEDVKTVEYSDAFKRFKQSFKYYDTSINTCPISLEDYKFLINDWNIEALNFLAELRNRIMHNGETLPNIFSFEHLVSQRLIPLVAEIIRVEKTYLKGYTPHFFETATGIKIIDEMLSVKFEIADLEDESKLTVLKQKLFKLAHLKELGRAAFNHDVIARSNRSFYEPYYENPVGRSERLAETERQHEDFYDIRDCTCCGTNSLVIYRKPIDVLWSNEKFISWFRCYNCGYSLKNNIEDPFVFGLADKLIFATK